MNCLLLLLVLGSALYKVQGDVEAAFVDGGYGSDSYEYGSESKYDSEYGSKHGSKSSTTLYGSEYASEYGSEYASEYGVPSESSTTLYGSEYASEYGSEYASEYGFESDAVIPSTPAPQPPGNGGVPDIQPVQATTVYAGRLETTFDNDLNRARRRYLAGRPCGYDGGGNAEGAWKAAVIQAAHADPEISDFRFESCSNGVHVCTFKVTSTNTHNSATLAAKFEAVIGHLGGPIGFVTLQNLAIVSAAVGTAISTFFSVVTGVVGWVALLLLG